MPHQKSRDAPLDWSYSVDSRPLIKLETKNALLEAEIQLNLDVYDIIVLKQLQCTSTRHKRDQGAPIRHDYSSPFGFETKFKVKEYLFYIKLRVKNVQNQTFWRKIKNGLFQHIWEHNY